MRAMGKTEVCITGSPGVMYDISHEDWLGTHKLIKLSSVQGFEQIHLGVGSRKAKKTTKIIIIYQEFELLAWCQKWKQMMYATLNTN